MASPPNPKNIPFNHRLIQLVYERPALWDRKEMARHDKSARKQIWEQIGQILNATATECENRWCGLRGTYRGTIRMQANGIMRGLDWEYLEELSFLRATMNLSVDNSTRSTTTSQARAGSSAPRRGIVLNSPGDAQNASPLIPGRQASLKRGRPEKLNAQELSSQACFLLSFEEMLSKAGPQKEMQLRAAITNLFLEHLQEEERLKDLAEQQDDS